MPYRANFEPLLSFGRSIRPARLGLTTISSAVMDVSSDRAAVLSGAGVSVRVQENRFFVLLYIPLLLDWSPGLIRIEQFHASELIKGVGA